MKRALIVGVIGIALATGYRALPEGATYNLQNGPSPFPVNAPILDDRGGLLTGTNYLVELYGGPTPEALQPGADLWDCNLRVIRPLRFPGYVTGESAICLVPGFHWAWLQVRAWDARLGGTYEEVVARGLGGFGESNLFYALGGLQSGNLGILPKPLFGLQSFRLRPLTTAVLMRGIRHEGDHIVVEWHPGFPRYQLQQTSALDQPWQDLGGPMTARQATIGLTFDARFFRVIGLLE